MSSSGTPHRDGGRRTAVAVLAVLALLGSALLVFALTSQVGAPPEPELRGAPGASDDGGNGEAPDAGPAGGDRSAGGASSSQEPDTGVAAPAEDDASQATEEPSVAALPASEPTGVRIDAIGVDEQVFPIGLGQNGELLAPRGEQADLAAWFEGSPTPGETGPAVIEGHVTWGGEPSVFFELGALAPGDRVEVDREDGTVAVFEVYDTARYPKDEFPTVGVYGRTDGPELRLITCGGDLGADGHHLDNTVVSARLIES